MNFRRQSKEEVTVNLTPLIDIVFLLLIFFMVSTTFTKENHLSISLPESSSEETGQPPKAIEILISESGEYSIDGQPLVNTKVETLKRAIEKTLDGRDIAPVVISADARTSHESVVRAMDAAGQLGLINLSITTRKSAGGD
ncbi:MAG: biopolymer transporter ExbD [Oceanospirillaceae bacterium]|uniref:ExbD/TolR family protein n=1 Tax=unclassified Thalassolituus TaxID=2624967 RepID=UPI000B6B8438|nr:MULTISPECIES: biopolymer transporter ExbD [unclassified Thalassolituus]MAE36083.1 biopolymer transporter ExbD [Oceanospirillaceae bacterium]MBN59502.1 biopolymer transporter ExbD [Oceanospirillaceae bacterium]MDQ4427126.1 biopolymer transporter ExbD [Thalassolituus sp.]OUX64347.1 MAG: biopolymer transporter ExbD [Oceanospirillaceae bacterium TMED276]